MARHPSVQQCAVIASPDDEWSELVHAHVVCKPGQTVTLEDLQGHCKSMIAGYKVRAA